MDSPCSVQHFDAFSALIFNPFLCFYQSLRQVGAAAAGKIGENFYYIFYYMPLLLISISQ